MSKKSEKWESQEQPAEIATPKDLPAYESPYAEPAADANPVPTDEETPQDKLQREHEERKAKLGPQPVRVQKSPTDPVTLVKPGETKEREKRDPGAKVGQIVHFVENPSAKPVPALVAYANAYGDVGVWVFPAGGAPYYVHDAPKSDEAAARHFHTV